MSKNITLLGASYSDVPAVLLPQTGGGTALFTDVSPTTATDSDVLSGKVYFKADGTQSTGTGSGGGSATIESLTVTPSTSQQTFNSSSVDGYKPVVVNAMPSGTAGTPTATKGSVSNHSISVTPSVTNTTGYITGSTKTGTAVTVSASELVSGSETKTANGTYDVTNLAELVVNVSGGGGSNWTLIKSGTLTVNTTSTSAASAGTLECGTTAWSATDILWVRIRGQSGKRNGYFYGSDAIFANYRAKNGSTSSDSVPAIQYYRVDSSGAYTSATGSYGVYAYSITNTGTLTIRRRYNSTNTLTINDTFDIEVYKLTLPTGKTLFT